MRKQDHANDAAVAIKRLDWLAPSRVPAEAWGEANLKQRVGHHHLGQFAGSYSIQELEPGGMWGWWCSWTCTRFPAGVEHTEQAAMAAAQADFEARICSMIELPVRSVADVLTEGRKLGVELAAEWVDQRCFGYVAEHGSYDPSTGATEFSSAGEEYVAELAEIAEGLRAFGAKS